MGPGISSCPTINQAAVWPQASLLPSLGLRRLRSTIQGLDQSRTRALADGIDEFFKRIRIYVVSYLLTPSFHPSICSFIHSSHQVKVGDLETPHPQKSKLSECVLRDLKCLGIQCIPLDTCCNGLNVYASLEFTSWNPNPQSCC